MILTRLKSPDSGSPPSRENAHACLEAAAKNPKVAKMYIAISSEIRAVVPALEFVAL